MPFKRPQYLLHPKLRSMSPFVVQGEASSEYVITTAFTIPTTIKAELSSTRGTPGSGLHTPPPIGNTVLWPIHHL